MALIDVLEAKDIDQLGQVLLGALDRGKEIVQELRDESEIVIEIPGPIRIHFKRKEKFQCPLKPGSLDSSPV
jgi:hypothetical protein